MVQQDIVCNESGSQDPKNGNSTVCSEASTGVGLCLRHIFVSWCNCIFGPSVRQFKVQVQGSNDNTTNNHGNGTKWANGGWDKWKKCSPDDKGRTGQKNHEDPGEGGLSGRSSAGLRWGFGAGAELVKMRHPLHNFLHSHSSEIHVVLSGLHHPAEEGLSTHCPNLSQMIRRFDLTKNKILVFFLSRTEVNFGHTTESTCSMQCENHQQSWTWWRPLYPGLYGPHHSILSMPCTSSLH